MGSSKKWYYILKYTLFVIITKSRIDEKYFGGE